MIPIFAEPLINHFETIWNLSEGVTPSFPRLYPSEEKKDREAIFSAYTGKLKSIQQERPDIQQIDTARFFEAMGKFLRQVYDFSDPACQIILHQDFIAVSKSFFREARKFDPALRSEEIYQAMRNAWIMNGLQLLLGKKVELTPSLLAYSLLYPYSDNLLDDPAITAKEKLQFCEKFGMRLMGQPAFGNFHLERKISELVGMIEQEFPRETFPEVYQSLLEIHDAQVQSLKLIHPANGLTTQEILRIGFYKGGASVLADGYLVEGKLSPEVRRFFFGFGVWLQMVDDLQDLPEDTKSGTHTLFSCNGSSATREFLSNRTFHFGRQIMEEISSCPAAIAGQFKEVIRHSVELMLIQSIGMNSKFYPNGYCHGMEAYSPIGYQYLRDARKKGSPGRMQLITRLMDVQ